MNRFTSKANMKLIPLIGALLLSGAPVFADGESDHSNFVKHCIGFEEMDEDTRIQKGKFCECTADLVYISKTERTLKEAALICLEEYPPLN